MKFQKECLHLLLLLLLLVGMEMEMEAVDGGGLPSKGLAVPNQPVG